MIKYFLYFLLLGSNTVVFAQQKHASEIFHQLQQVANTGTVMYIAAHPDDENTRLISYLSNSQHYKTIYLSLTRGDGGQNLIGNEKGELLGLLRTQELLEARAVDKGEQWFTRAIDFGYSKTATETFTIWDKQELLADVVYAIRKHKPDVIITRFDPESNGKTHGHHTASAILAQEAFRLANNKDAFPQQLAHVDVWQPKRLFYNTSWWFYGSKEAFDKADKANMIPLNVGEYYPLLGESNNEIAARSRSKHACQGFGSARSRGTQTEWLTLLDGDMPTNGNIMQGIDTSWDRRDPSGNTTRLFNEAIDSYNFSSPVDLLPVLLSIKQTNKNHTEIDNLIQQVTGFFIEANTTEPYAAIGDSISITLELIARAIPTAIQDISIHSPFSTKVISIDSLAINRSTHISQTIIANNKQINTPYWLTQQSKNALYQIDDQNNLGLPESEPLQVTVNYNIQGVSISHSVPLLYKQVDPAKGEIYEPFYMVPPVAVNFLDPVQIVMNNEEKEIMVRVSAFTDSISGIVQLDAGYDYIIEQAKPFSITSKNETQDLYFRVIPTKENQQSKISASVTLDNGNSYFHQVDIVDYEHIQKQMVFMPAQSSLSHISLQVPDVSIGYIEGSGDEIPESLKQIGLPVTVIEEQELQMKTLQSFDVIILGIRAFNTNQALANHTSILWEYVEQGGTVISQYNTNRRLLTEEIAPLPLELGRKRIAEEQTSLTILQTNHKVFLSPNTITSTDFDGWVQERGLYFAEHWSPAFIPLLEGHDIGEENQKGMLLVAGYGKGHYIYTGLSFFRELPAGVPGAYRLFTNIIAINHE